MRRFDKKDNIRKANLLSEQRYLESKGLISENEDWDLESRKQQYGINPEIDQEELNDENTYKVEVIGKESEKDGGYKHRWVYEITANNEEEAEAKAADKFKQNLGSSDIYLFSVKTITDSIGIDEDSMESQFSKPSFADAIIKGTQDSLHEEGEKSNDTYFETLSEALDAVRQKAAKLGLELDEDAIWTNFGTGGISYDTEKSANIPLLKNGEPILDKRGKEANRYIHVSIYRMPSGRYELTMYKTW